MDLDQDIWSTRVRSRRRYRRVPTSGGEAGGETASVECRGNCVPSIKSVAGTDAPRRRCAQRAGAVVGLPARRRRLVRSDRRMKERRSLLPHRPHPPRSRPFSGDASSRSSAPSDCPGRARRRRRPRPRDLAISTTRYRCCSMIRVVRLVGGSPCCGRRCIGDRHLLTSSIDSRCPCCG